MGALLGRLIMTHFLKKQLANPEVLLKTELEVSEAFLTDPECYANSFGA